MKTLLRKTNVKTYLRTTYWGLITVLTLLRTYNCENDTKDTILRKYYCEEISEDKIFLEQIQMRTNSDFTILRPNNCENNSEVAILKTHKCENITEDTLPWTDYLGQCQRRLSKLSTVTGQWTWMAGIQIILYKYYDMKNMSSTIS